MLDGPRRKSTEILQWIETSCGQLAAVGNCDSNVLAELGELAVGCRLAGMATEPWSIRISSRLERLGQLRELKRLVMEIGEQQGVIVKEFLGMLQSPPGPANGEHEKNLFKKLAVST